ncbi:uncharacterized protein LOC122334247 isoform X2 [Puntigrus tetrazona]|uniref:uncharacterized protein LOC122334247 isoform X2 n=1 Tax=Puntigrus tetrazona TaxID=1606681 RepID=UPI001C89FD4D|nr:uncharacterized protein LOC122334247 isoform X2 [Puntigrus tetrazona]
MACAHQSATNHLRRIRTILVAGMKNLPLIIENLYAQKIFNDYEVDALKAERSEFDKARCILDWVVNKGEIASYELLRILDVTQKRTLHPDSRCWVNCFPFRVEDTDTSYSVGTKPCQIYQTQLKMKAKSILKNQRKCCHKYLDDKAASFIPLVLETDSVVKSPHCKIKLKNKKCKKARPKKLKAYIPNEERALSPEHLLKWQDKNILIIGKPGIGKTTVVQEMLRLWSEKDDRELDYMFYFDERVLARSSSAPSLKSVLFDVYLKPKDKDRKDVFQDIEENSDNVVVVFDGVTDLEENSILWKIMNHELLPDAKVIITCRSEVEDDVLFSNWPTQKVYVQGFSEESIKTYYRKMLGHDSALLDVILKNQELFSLSHVPLYAFMIVDLIKFKNDTVCNHPHTVTEMYIHIFRLAVKKHGNKKKHQIDGYLKEMKGQFDPLMENAFSATMQKCLNLPDVSSDETDVCHAFLKMITTTDSPTSATTYCAFLHNTMQEFFSALWLLGHPDEIEKVLQHCLTEEHKHMRHVLPYLCGLLSEHNIRLLNCLFPEDQIIKTSAWFIKKLLDNLLQFQSENEEFDLLYVCQCLYELQSPKACRMFLEKVDHQLDLEVDLDPHQCCALSYVIGQSRDEEVYLNLEDCNMTNAGLKMMLTCSPNIRFKTFKEPLKEIKFFSEFFHELSHCSCRFSELREQNSEKCNALLDLYSHVKNYEAQTGKSFFKAFQSVFLSPDVWIVDLSQRKSSVLLELLKLQPDKPVELRGCSEEESEVVRFLQCLPYISQLSCSEPCLLTLVKVVQLRENLQLVGSLYAVLGFSLNLEGQLTSKTCSLSGYMLVKIVQALRSSRVQVPITVCKLKLVQNDKQRSERNMSRVLSSLGILLRLWTVECVNLTEYTIQSASVSLLLCHQNLPILRPSKETLQKLVEYVYEAQEEELTRCLLQKVGGDLTSCSLNWEELRYFLLNRIQHITVDFRKTNIQCAIREILPFLDRVKFNWVSSSFILSVIGEIYESDSVSFVPGLLSSVENYINLQSRELDSVHCKALRSTLQHCSAVTLNLIGTSIPEEELEGILPLFKHVSQLSVDRLLLLKMLHCCSASGVQQEAVAVLLSVLQHKLDFSCLSAQNLTTNTDVEPLHLTADDCRVISTVIQRAHADTKTQLILQDCEINTAGVHQLFSVFDSVQLCCSKSLLLQFLAHVSLEEAESLSRALGEELDLSQTPLDPRVCGGLKLILEYSEGLTELDLSQCHLTDDSLDLLLPNLHKAQNIDFSGNRITDFGALKIYFILAPGSNIKTLRLFNNRIKNKDFLHTDPRIEIC